MREHRRKYFRLSDFDGLSKKADRLRAPLFRLAAPGRFENFSAGFSGRTRDMIQVQVTCSSLGKFASLGINLDGEKIKFYY